MPDPRHHPTLTLIELIRRLRDNAHEDGSLLRLEQWLRQSERLDDANLVRRKRYSRRAEKLSLGMWIWNRLYGASTVYGTVVWRVAAIALLAGAAALVLPALTVPPTWKTYVSVLTTICGSLAALAFAFVADFVKRRVWPQ